MPFVQNPLVDRVLPCVIDVHRVLGPGLLERAYKECLTYELAAGDGSGQELSRLSSLSEQLTMEDMEKNYSRATHRSAAASGGERRTVTPGSQAGLEQ